MVTLPPPVCWLTAFSPYSALIYWRSDSSWHHWTISFYCHIIIKDCYIGNVWENAQIWKLFNIFFSYLQIIAKCVSTCLLQASKYKSIVFPALGTGQLRYPRHLVAETMYKCVSQFDQNNTSLKEVKFLCYDDETIRVISFLLNMKNEHYLSNKLDFFFTNINDVFTSHVYAFSVLCNMI